MNMSKLVECMKSELDLFEPHPIQTSILNTEEVAYNPIATLDSPSSIEFVCLGNGDTYRDLSSVYLRLILQLKAPDNTDLPDDSIGVVNNILHSLFRSVSVYLNNVPVSHSDNNYHYKSYIQTFLNYGSDASRTHLTSSGWYPDNYINDEIHKGQTQINKLFTKSNKVELIGRVHGDIFSQPKLLLNNVDLRIVFNLEKSSFYMMDPNSTGAHLKILEAQLYMNHITVNPGILLAHHKILQQKPAIYPLNRTEIKSFTMYPGNHSLSLDNVVIGQLPTFLAFCMVGNGAYTGNCKINPFEFQHFYLQTLNLSVNGTQVPSQALEFDYSGSNPRSTRAYNMLFNSIGIKNSDRGIHINKRSFDNGSFILGFDLSPDHSNNDLCAKILKQGNIRIEGKFARAFAEPVTCLVYCEYDSMIEIDKNRNVKVTL